MPNLSLFILIPRSSGPWVGSEVGKEMVRIGLKCSVDQLLNTGLFHGKENYILEFFNLFLHLFFSNSCA
jgi:hypothetical protein